MTDEKKSNLEIKSSAQDEVKTSAWISLSASAESKRRGVLDERSLLEDKVIGQPSEGMPADKKESNAGKGDTKRGVSTAVSRSFFPAKAKQGEEASLSIPASLLRKIFHYLIPIDLARSALVSKEFLTGADGPFELIRPGKVDFMRSKQTYFTQEKGVQLRSLISDELIRKPCTTFLAHEVLLQPQFNPQGLLGWAVCTHIMVGRLTPAEAFDQIAELRELSVEVLTSDLVVAKIIQSKLLPWQAEALGLTFTLTDLCSDWLSEAHVQALNAFPPQGTMAQLRGLKAHPQYGFTSPFTPDERRENWFTHIHTEAVAFGKLPIEKVRNKSEQEVLCAWLGVRVWFKSKVPVEEIWQAAIARGERGFTCIEVAVLKDMVGFLSALERISQRSGGVEWRKAFTTRIRVKDDPHEGLTPLHVAATRNGITVLEIIRRCGNYDDKAWAAAIVRPARGKFQGQTPVGEAIKRGYWGMLKSMWINGGYANLQWQAIFRDAVSVADKQNEEQTLLYVAALRGDLERLEAIYRYGNYDDKTWPVAMITPLIKGRFRGQTPVDAAMKSGYWGVLKSMWINGGYANLQWQRVFRAAVQSVIDEEEQVPLLFRAAEENNVQRLEAIYCYGGYTPETWEATITAILVGGERAYQWQTPLGAAVGGRCWAALESMWIKSSHASPLWRTLFISPNRYGETPLYETLSAGNVEGLEAIYRYGGYIPKTWQAAITTPLEGKGGYTALYAAFMHGHLAALKSMRIKGGYDKRQWQAAVTTSLTSGNRKGDTPLQALIMKNPVDVLNGMQVICDCEIDEWRQMINAPPSCGYYQGVEFIGILSVQDKVDVLNRLWESGRYTAPLWRTAMTTSSTEAVDQYQDRTPLYNAAMNGSAKVLEHFRVHGQYKPKEWLKVMTTPLTSGPHQGRTPLYAAALNGKEDILYSLRRHSGCTDTQWWQAITAPLADGYDRGISPLQAAINGGHPVTTWAKTVTPDIQPIFRSRASSGPSVLAAASASSFFGSLQAETKRAVAKAETKGVEEEVTKSKEEPSSSQSFVWGPNADFFQ